MSSESHDTGSWRSSVNQVAYLVNVYPSPSHTFIRREILALEAAGWRVHRFSHRRNRTAPVEPADAAEFSRTCVLLGLPLHILAFGVLTWLMERPRATVAALHLAMRMAWHGDRRYLAYAAYFAMACALSRRLRHLDCRHVHAHMGTNPAAVACLANRLCGLKYSITFHAPYEFDPRQMINLREKIGNASFIAAVSDAGHRQLTGQHKDFAVRIRMIRCGLDARWFTFTARMTQPGPELVCVARLEQQKDPFLLLKAVKILAERGVFFRLKIAGDGSLHMAMESFIAKSGLGSIVVLVGWQTEEQIVEHLRAARALVLSSRSEGLPVAIMEAFALGIPAIAPDVGGVNELVETGATGWLVPCGDAEALADAVYECLLAPPEELGRLGAEAHRRIQSYNIRGSAGQLIEGFQESTDSDSVEPLK